LTRLPVMCTIITYLISLTVLTTFHGSYQEKSGKVREFKSTKVQRDEEKILNCSMQTVYISSNFFCTLRLQIICTSTFELVPPPLFLV